MKNEDNLKVVVAIEKKELLKLKGTSNDKSKRLELASIIIACMAVVVSIVFGVMTIVSTQEHNKQSVMPLLSAWRAENNDSSSITWSVYNAGLGPAKIKEAKAFILGTEYEGYLGSSNFEQKITLDNNMIVDIKWNSIIVKDDIIKDGDDAEILTIKWNDGEIPTGYDADKHLVFAYCYCSVYNECSYEDSRSGGEHFPYLNCLDN